MNLAYFLAYKLGIPIIVQPAWDNYLEEKRKSDAELLLGHNLLSPLPVVVDPSSAVALKASNYIKKAAQRNRKARHDYRTAVFNEIEDLAMTQINWKTGYVCNVPYRKKG